jgi:hypothetical protein
LIPVAAFALFAAIALRLAVTAPFPAPDELQHVSYAAYLQETGRLLPRFEAQLTLQQDDLSRWDTRPNYIGHPSPFYLFAAAFLDRSLPPSLAVLPLRVASLALIALGLALALLAGFRCFADDVPALLAFCAALVFCPQLLAASGQVTNDSLALLGGALAYWGAAEPGRRSAAFATGAGLLLALWAKPNAGLAVGCFVGIACCIARPARPFPFLAAGAGILIGVVPYLFMLARYGTIVPVTAEGLNHLRLLPGFFRYLPIFLLNLGRTWGSLHIRRWPIAGPLDWFTIAAFWAVVTCTVLAAWQARRRPGEPAAVVAMAVSLALAVVLAAHLWFACARLGYSWPAASFRYELPLWPAMAHALGYAVRAAPGRWTRAAVTAATAAIVICAGAS